MSNPKPSKRAQKMMKRAQEAAIEEVRRHLSTGKAVYGYRDGERGYLMPDGRWLTRAQYDKEMTDKSNT